ncbi:hypothetical protein ACZ87_00415, partial [Candidatus Erwinia dacicola]
SAARTTDWLALLTRLSTLRMKWTRQRLTAQAIITATLTTQLFLRTFT